MGAFISSAVEAKLKADTAAEQEKPWMRFAGIFKDRRADSQRVLLAIEQACEDVRAEDWQ